MRTATLHIADLAAANGDTNVYHLNTPHSGFDYVAVCTYPVQYGEWHNAGVEVFGCDATGHIPTMDTLYQSYVIESDGDVLAHLGYTLTEQEQ